MYFVAECGALPEPLHGTLSLTGTSFGSEAKYNCDDGYELEGSKERTCKGDGQWSGTNVVCKAVGESKKKPGFLIHQDVYRDLFV